MAPGMKPQGVQLVEPGPAYTLDHEANTQLPACYTHENQAKMYHPIINTPLLSEEKDGPGLLPGQHPHPSVPRGTSPCNIAIQRYGDIPESTLKCISYLHRRGIKPSLPESRNSNPRMGLISGQIWALPRARCSVYKYTQNLSFVNWPEESRSKNRHDFR